MHLIHRVAIEQAKLGNAQLAPLFSQTGIERGNHYRKQKERNKVHYILATKNVIGIKQGLDVKIQGGGGEINTELQAIKNMYMIREVNMFDAGAPINHRIQRVQANGEQEKCEENISLTFAHFDDQ